MNEPARRSVVVWDLATRIFHWLLAIAVAINLFVVSPRGDLNRFVHFSIGYGVLGLLLFRIAWGFLGSPHSRFADFIRGWPAARGHIEGLKRGQPQQWVGHNPLGGWMIATLIGTLSLMVATGLFASDRRASGPLAHLIAKDWSNTIGDVHSLVSDILIGLIGLHLFGVALHWYVNRENLVASMLHGRKSMPAEQARKERPLASGTLAAVLGMIVFAIAAGLVWLTG